MISEAEPCQPCKKPWTEYKIEMEKAANVFRREMGSYAYDNHLISVKHYAEGYLAGMNRMIQELDL